MSEEVRRERMGGDPLTGKPHFVEAVHNRKDSPFPMPMNVEFDEENGGALIRNFDGYVLPPSEIRGLFELALQAAAAYGEEEILRHNREMAAHDKEQQALLEEQRWTAPKRTARPGYVYLLGGGGYYKIGKAKDPQRRAETLAVQLPYSVELLHAIESGDYARAEEYLHERFAHKRLNGEWFDLSDDDVAEITALSSLYKERQ
jgi:hypothetical protein